MPSSPSQPRRRIMTMPLSYIVSPPRFVRLPHEVAAAKHASTRKKRLSVSSRTIMLKLRKAVSFRRGPRHSMRLASASNSRLSLIAASWHGPSSGPLN
ncbi:hypothetical protein AURDEDRAFT_147264 [Auricularia subglabra TFB-10046 SS5]|nr:hypothetical protein AURDEDRAFT_147264 [Auricularia subglabra TFB-10046 SS5]